MEHAETGQVYRGNLDKLIAKIDAERGLDLGQYRRQYLERRMATRLRSLNLHSYRQYADHLDEYPEEYNKLLDTLTINVTEFFRDTPVYDIFASKIAPAMIEEKLRTRHRMIRAWSAGCATGEEPYSITMALLEALGTRSEGFLLNVLGTDLDELALAKARAAVYPIDRLAHIPENLRVNYLDVEDQSFRIKPEVTKHVRFRRLNLFTDRPISMVDVIFCRNVFIYFSREQQDKILSGFWSALSRGGYLVLGRSEKLSPAAAGRFELVNGRERIYRKPDDM